MGRWKDNLDSISPIFRFLVVVRKVIYIQCKWIPKFTYQKQNCQYNVFPRDTLLLNRLYLETFEATKMDNVDKKLGKGLSGIKNYVCEMPAGIKKK